MSADGSIKLNWADGEHLFRLPLGQLRELQEKCDAGPQEILDRLTLRRWRVDDVREVIRLGLIGGGMAPTPALALVVRYVDARPWAESVPHATMILLAAIVGVKDDQPGKQTPAADNPSAAGFPSGTFTAPVAH